MSINQVTSADLCAALASGWTEERASIPHEFVARLAKRCHAHIISESAGASTYLAKLEVPQVRLYGLQNLGCLIVGSVEAAGAEILNFLRDHDGAGRLAVVLPANNEV